MYNANNITQEEIQRAHKVNLAELLLSSGVRLKTVGSENMLRLGDKTITIRNNLWFNHYEQVGGDTISFFIKFYDMSYFEALQFILGKGSHIETCEESYDKTNKSLVLPPKNSNMKRVFGYLLNTRGIDKNVLSEFVRRGMIYEGKDYHEVVFVGFDKNGVPRHANRRASSQQSSFKQNTIGSDGEYSFHWIGDGDAIFLFEAPIDMLSFITMNSKDWMKYSYAAACSVASKCLDKCLHDFPKLKRVYICFDNDASGASAASRIFDDLKLRGYKVAIIKPRLKDWNDDLMYYRKGVL